MPYRHRLAVVLLSAALAACGGGAQDSQGEADTESRRGGQPSIAGTWQLVQAVDWDSAGNASYPFGSPPDGTFFYDPTGHVSVQIMTTPPIPFDTATAQFDTVAAFNNYLAYFGTYSVRGDSIHQTVEGSLDPTMMGTDQARPFTLVGRDTLVLGVPDSAPNQYRRVLVRVR